MQFSDTKWRKFIAIALYYHSVQDKLGSAVHSFFQLTFIKRQLCVRPDIQDLVIKLMNWYLKKKKRPEI